MEANFNDRLTNLIGKCYDAIAEIVKNKAQESAYIDGETIYSLIFDLSSNDNALFVHYTTSDNTNTKYYNDCWIYQIDYHHCKTCGTILLISEDGVKIPIEDINDSDVCAITDYIIKHYE